jgi:crotonobetainyl-CoA:carnitine CoA-transferase CaiB-like acyl-CoA transferase
MIAEELKHRTTAEWLDLLEQNDIPCMRPHTLESLLEDPHLTDADFLRWVEHPSEGRVRSMREPSTWSETPPPDPDGHFSPRIGQHTREILAEAGYSAAEIDALIAENAVMAEG